MHKIRYIIDKSYGSTNDLYNTSWIEIQALDADGVNIAEGKTVKANFVPNRDVSGQAGLETLTNDNINQEEYVSVNVAVLPDRDATVVIDLGKEYEIAQLKLYHGWWTRRAYKNKVYVAKSLTSLEEVYNYFESDAPQYEAAGEPLIINL